MALAGGIGADLEPVSQVSGAGGWFAEDQGRFVVTVAEASDQRFIAAAKKAGVAVTLLGYTEGDAIQVDNGEATLGGLRSAHEGFFPALMGADAALA
jgi:phosphoribosylformylglycinamidine synthase